jgi:hypothetical protein
MTVRIDAAAFRAFERAGWEAEGKATSYAAACETIQGVALRYPGR